MPSIGDVRPSVVRLIEVFIVRDLSRREDMMDNVLVDLTRDCDISPINNDLFVAFLITSE